jgi:hypothetical protein
MAAHLKPPRCSASIRFETIRFQKLCEEKPKTPDK